MNSNKSYRIKANPGADGNLSVQLDIGQSYDTIDILSVSIDQKNNYNLHSSNYGIIVGRVIANGGFGVPNAKVSVFIEAGDDTLADPVMAELYPFTSTQDKNSDGIRYNLLPDYEVASCHQAIGSMPSKQYILDNDTVLEVFDRYYRFTARTNNSGDYFISGIPTGECRVHMDVDLSDCGVLSQKPRDFVYKGYNIEQFDNPNKFKSDTEIDRLSQVFTQDKTVNVIPFWGNEASTPEIGITRLDFEVAFKFETTCVFIGSAVSDNKSNGISKKCVPTEEMGAMDELVSGEGRIEMIRKRPDGDVEEFQINGTELINANGVWCYQIPMNLDYVITDEYGNMVPSDDPGRGIATRTRIRFRMSMQEFEENQDFYHRAKALVPNNPENPNELDYNFGTQTKDTSFRDLFWDNVYTVKSYIPRIQKFSTIVGVDKENKNCRYSGIKHCNINGSNNPMPYNNIKIKMPFSFTLSCSLWLIFIKTANIINKVIFFFGEFLGNLYRVIRAKPILDFLRKIKYIHFSGEDLCPEMENWYFAPGGVNKRITSVRGDNNDVNIFTNTYRHLIEEGGDDQYSVDSSNSPEQGVLCLTNDLDHLVSCLEMTLAEEHKVVRLDFYNDWMNGSLYFPRWVRYVRKKRKFLGMYKPFGVEVFPEKVKGCMNDPEIFDRRRYLGQQCALSYQVGPDNNLEVTTPKGCNNGKRQICHTNAGAKEYSIFGKNGGLVNEHPVVEKNTRAYVYYLKPCEFDSKGRRTLLFATDIVLMGSLRANDVNGIPQAFKGIPSSTYKLPTNIAHTNMEGSGYSYGSGSKSSKCSSSDNEKGNKTAEIESNADKQNFKDYQEMLGRRKKYTELDDPIAVTESSGIAWNYTGPGQGKQDKKALYQPGGMFLGISCFRPETNIKSCVNLQRVCELGAEVSQRGEGIREIIDGKKAKYYYVVPNGIAGKDDMSEDTYRSMFSTLNSHRLIADSIDPNTSYPAYSFRYLNPNSFGGELRSVISGSDKFDRRVDPDEINDLFFNGNFNEVKISENYDKEEAKYTFMHSSEIASEDYIKFRLGIDKVDPQSVGSKMLISGNSMPQYENSFYFYFGIKEGATAIDELKKTFFSSCEQPKYFTDKMRVSATSDIGTCDLSSDVIVTIVNGKSPYTITLRDKDGKVVKKPINTESNRYEIKDVLPGNYTINVKSYTEDEAECEIYCGPRLLDFLADSKGFLEPIPEETDPGTVINEYAGTTNGERINLYGGLVKMDSSFKIKGRTYSFLEDNKYGSKVYAVLVSSRGEWAYISNTDGAPDPPAGAGIIGDPYRNVFSRDNNGNILMHLWKDNEIFGLYVGFKCKDTETQKMPYNYIHYDDFSIGTLDRITMYHGEEILDYENTLSKLPAKWWDSIDRRLAAADIKSLPEWTDASLTPDKIWILRHYIYRYYDILNEKFSPFNSKVGFEGNNVNKVLIGKAEKIENGELALTRNVMDTTNDAEYRGYTLSDSYIMSTSLENSVPYGVCVYDDEGRALGSKFKLTVSEDGVMYMFERGKGAIFGPEAGYKAVLQIDETFIVSRIMACNDDSIRFDMDDFRQIKPEDRKVIYIIKPYQFRILSKPFRFNAVCLEYSNSDPFSLLANEPDSSEKPVKDMDFKSCIETLSANLSMSKTRVLDIDIYNRNVFEIREFNKENTMNDDVTCFFPKVNDINFNELVHQDFTKESMKTEPGEPLENFRGVITSKENDQESVKLTIYESAPENYMDLKNNGFIGFDLNVIEEFKECNFVKDIYVEGNRHIVASEYVDFDSGCEYYKVSDNKPFEDIAVNFLFRSSSTDSFVLKNINDIYVNGPIDEGGSAVKEEYEGEGEAIFYISKDGINGYAGVKVSKDTSSLKQVAEFADLPTSGVTFGDVYLVTSSNRVYIRRDTDWEYVGSPLIYTYFSKEFEGLNAVTADNDMGNIANFATVYLKRSGYRFMPCGNINKDNLNAIIKELKEGKLPLSEKLIDFNKSEFLGSEEYIIGIDITQDAEETNNSLLCAKIYG